MPPAMQGFIDLKTEMSECRRDHGINPYNSCFEVERTGTQRNEVIFSGLPSWE